MDQELILHTSRGEGSFLFGYFLVWGHGNGLWLSFLCDYLNEKHAGILMLSMLNFLGFKTEFLMLYLLNFLGLKTEENSIWCSIVCMKNMKNFMGFHACLAVKTKRHIQIYNTITKGLLSNPRQRLQKLVE